MTQVDENIKEQLRLRLPAFIEALNGACDVSGTLSAHEKTLLRTYLGEVAVGLELISPHLKPGMRILEIGSGIGALGIFLAQNGIDIQGIEPVGDGFDIMTTLSEFVKSAAGECNSFTPKSIAAEDLSEDSHGLYDLIFSVHVLEHVPDVDRTFSAMTAVLKPGGSMVHLCPNYTFPYDPHFFIPILFWSPRFTAFVYKSHIGKAPSLWASLNFIRSGQIKKLAVKHGMERSFQKGVMADFFERLLTDTVFSMRHKGFAAKCAAAIARSPFIALLRIMPASCTSPMIITLKKPIT